MTKVKTKAQQVPTFEMTDRVSAYLQEQVDFLAERAVSQLGIVANWANIAQFQKHASFDQMFGNDYGLAPDSNQKVLKYCAQSVANSPEQLVQIRPSGNVYGAQDAQGVQSTVFSDADQNKIQVSEMAFEAIFNASERYSKALSDIVMLNGEFALEPTTSRTERYEAYVLKEHDMKRRKSENQARSEAKFAQNREADQVVVQLHKVAQTTAHLV
jgi:hypothetical protein